jgi:hypothetical protein
LELANLRDLARNYRSAGTERFILAGVLECWSAGVLECWSAGVLECWHSEARFLATQLRFDALGF